MTKLAKAGINEEETIDGEDLIVYIDNNYLLRKSGKLCSYNAEKLSYDDYMEATSENLNETTLCYDVKNYNSPFIIKENGELYELKYGDSDSIEISNLQKSNIIGFMERGSMVTNRWYYDSNKTLVDPISGFEVNDVDQATECSYRYSWGESADIPLNTYGSILFKSGERVILGILHIRSEIKSYDLIDFTNVSKINMFGYKLKNGEWKSWNGR